ncbi:hypothetical protein ABVV53_06300 [Novosphingobium sp. RD2P27]|uniref:OsmC-like protein n=1 Tax=Novosphingobium kalidii TaxID=3230299 RepID=A0ABV2CZN7_9SPHN
MTIVGLRRGHCLAGVSAVVSSVIAKHTTRAVKALKIHCPVDDAMLNMLSAGQLPAIDPDSALAKILDIVRAENPLGDFGVYKSVVELGSGWELFTSDAAARPALGQTGLEVASPTVILTIYIPMDAADDAVCRAIDAIVEAHPWEVPVIEISETVLVTRV